MPLLKTLGACVMASALATWFLLDRTPEVSHAALAQEPRAALAVGQQIAPDDVHVLGEPGRYGLGPQVRGSRYGISDGKLIRFDPTTFEVQSILRRQHQLPD